jgi:peptide/nickel transport system substrate-binding protein
MIQKTRRRRSAAILVAAVALAVVAASCSSGSGSGTKADKPNSSIVVAMDQGTLRTLDPNNGYEPEWFVISHQVYQTLVSFSGADVQKVTPALAESWTISPDSTSYTFKIDPRAKFADGSAVTAEDAAFALRRFKNTKGPGAWLLDNLADAQAQDGQTLVVTLKASDVSFLSVLTSPSLAIGKAETIKANGGTDAPDADKSDKAQPWLNQHSVGSGPYVLKSWVNNTELVLERNPNYWGPDPAPTADRVVFKFVADSNSQMQMVQRGDAAVAMNLTPDQLASLNSPSVSIAKTQALGVMYLGWTASASVDKSLANPANWEAIRNALDYKGIVDLARGAGAAAGGIVPAALAGGLTAADAPSENLDAARAALAKAGNPQGFSFTLAYASQTTAAGVPFDPVAQKIQTDLGRVGIKVKLQPMLQVKFYADYRAGKLPAVLHWWLADYADALNFLPVFVPPGSVAEVRQHWTKDLADPKLVEMAAKSLTTQDPQARATLVQDAQRLLNQTGPYTALIDIQRQVAYNNGAISDLATNPAWVVDFAASRSK